MTNAPFSVGAQQTQLTVSRHPLGLPPGSVRAMLSLMICGLFWILISLPADKNVPIPLFLYFLLSLILVFFVAHGSTIGRASGSLQSPLHLPRGTFRVFIVLGSAAAVGWQDRKSTRLNSSHFV